MENLPVFFEISEIENYLKSIKNKKDTIAYLIYLREEFIKICYHFSDPVIGKYIIDRKINIINYEKIPFILSGDFEETHISRSVYVLLLKHIDNKLLPLIRAEINKLDSGIIEDSSKIIRDYKIFDFDLNKILEYSNGLINERLNYLEWIIHQYIGYKVNKLMPVESKNDETKKLLLINQLYSNDFVTGIKKRINIVKRNPGIIISYNSKNPVLTVLQIKKQYLFNNEPLLFKFNFNHMKAHLKSIDGLNDKILYLEYVKKEVLQNKELLEIEDHSVYLLDKINIELDYLKKNINDVALLGLSDNVNNKQSTIDALIKFRWQKDNVLLPYLFELLHSEGFISQSDYEDRHKFIEQSFLKKNGKPFTPKETDQSEVNYHSNSKNKKKPRYAFKIDRVVSKLKDKEKKPK